MGFNFIEVDYVFYFDFWWNFVVEDQVSDCVYCMGQQCLVIVYCFVSEDIIEEKIVQLY